MRVALTDLVPTALDLLGLSADSLVGAWQERLDGRSLLRPLDPERLIVVVNTDEHVQWSRKGYAVVADDWKYINYSWRGSMLFDLATDSMEQRDLLAGGESALSRLGSGICAACAPWSPRRPRWPTSTWSIEVCSGPFPPPLPPPLNLVRGPRSA